MSKLELANVLATFSSLDGFSKSYLERKQGERSRGGQEDGAFICAQLSGRGMVSEALSLLAQPRKWYTGPLFSFRGPLHWHAHRLQLFHVLFHLSWESRADLILSLKDILSFFSERRQQSRHDWGAHVNGCFNCWAFCHHSPMRIKVTFSSYHPIF